MWYQAIPFCLITILLVLVIARASKTSLLSIFTLGVIAINFLCAVFLHLHPRSGRPFVSLSAMVFFGKVGPSVRVVHPNVPCPVDCINCCDASCVLV